MADEFFTQIKNELIRSSKLTPNEKAVLFVLLSYGSCKEIFVKQKKIAEQANVSRATVKRAVRKFKTMKLLSTKITPDRSTASYTLLTKAVGSQGANGGVTQTQGVGSQGATNSNKRLSNKTIEKKKLTPEIILPDWLDKKAWSEYVQHRKEIKNKLTPSSAKKQISFLSEHKKNHIEIIDQSIRNGWRGLFKLKKENDPTTGKLTKEEQRELDDYLKSTK